MKSPYHVVIPARLASERLPGKPLIEIAGKPLIEHVFRRARAGSAQRVVIATDAEEIAACARAFGAEVVMTSAAHQSGSDRIAECVRSLGWSADTVIVNLQGDEPLMPAACLDQVAALLAADPTADAASLYWPVSEPEEAADPNVVKVVTDSRDAALYFSRSVIPHPRGAAGLAQAVSAGASWKRHIGLYAYRAAALAAFTAAAPGILERIEKLEQLRFLENGRRIVMAPAVQFIPAGVDTPDDLRRVRDLLATTPGPSPSGLGR
ncbi:MAG: 3-deoxy-manno-octulosonate cytidylyltransferase [Xanthomonadales bacterium]|nr:3-deoxy-manno-octulosonate cytidylyltransferase [Xanthomonadales bacterium]